MGHVWLTNHRDIDSATVEIAVALRKACPVLCGDQDHYEQAAALRDQIMRGTRELDHEAALARADQGVHPHPCPSGAEDTGRYDREAREEFKRTGAIHTHVATSGNRVTRPGSRCPGATCYAMAVNEIDDEATHVIREGR